MLALSLIQWWYTKGWGILCSGLRNKLKDAADFFSIGSLLKTLFAPFRQISANASGTSLESRIAAFFDKLLSRVIGAIVRIFIIVFGMVTIMVETFVGIALILAWPLVPLVPAGCVGLAVMGVA